MRKSAAWLLMLPCAVLAEQATLSESERLALMSEGVHFLPDVVGQFSALSTRPDALGFHKGDSPNPSRCKHYQGMVRYQGSDDTPYFIISRSGNTPPIPNLPDGVSCGELNGGDDDDPGNLLVIRMGSREKHGERMRSNRIRRNSENADTPPEANDALATYITFDGTGGWPNYGHPGGMQAVGDVVGVPMETPYSSAYPEARILFIDLSTPDAPTLSSHFDPDVPGMKAGLMGFTPQANGKYLMLISGGTNETIWFYESVPNMDNGTPDDPSDDYTDLKSATLDWLPVDTWTTAEDGADVGASWPTGGAAHQSLSFLREGGIDGPLYVAGARNTVTAQYFGSDHIDLYRVQRTGNEIKLQRVATSHKNTHPNSDGSITLPETPITGGTPITANFATASTFYSSPAGELLFYATEHDNDGPSDSLFGPGTIKAGEWRHTDMARPGSPTRNPTADAGGPYSVDEGATVAVSGVGRPAISKAWIQFFSNRDYSDRYVVFDYDDRFKDNFEDFKDLDGDILDTRFGFDDIASSWSWFAPQGCTIRANDDSFGDGDFPGSNTRTLVGEGLVQRSPDLRDVCNNANAFNSDGTERDCSGNNGQMDDEITSSQFFPNCDDYYAAEPSLGWDMDRDGFPDTFAANADFSAAGLDGPSRVSLPLHAVHPTDGSEGVGYADVVVNNVPPVIQAITLRDDLGQLIGSDIPFAIVGLDVFFDGTFSDAGTPDTHTASIEWGDGGTDDQSTFDQYSDSTGGALGLARDRHIYADPGQYPVRFEVVDDDGGMVDAVTPLEVISVRDALQSLVDEINAMIEAATDPKLKAALIAIRNALIGNNNGLANNGALDAYDAENLKETFVKFRAVLTAVEEAEIKLSIDLTHVKNILGLAAKSIITGVYNDRVAATPDPSPGQLSQLETMQALIAYGNERLQQLDYRGAIDAYHAAL